MFFLCLCGFSPGTPVSSHIPTWNLSHFEWVWLYVSDPEMERCSVQSWFPLCALSFQNRLRHLPHWPGINGLEENSLSLFLSLLLILTLGYFFFSLIFQREGNGKGREKERSIDVRETRRLVAFSTRPYRSGMKPAASYLRLTGSQTKTLRCAGPMLYPLIHAGQGY